MFCKRKIYILGLICTSLLLLTSCGIKNKNTRIDLKNKISYVETSPHVTIDEIKKFDSTFKQLPLNKYTNLFSLLKDKNNYIWLKAEFTLPEELKNKDLAFFITYLKPANNIWLNNSYLGGKGLVPEHNTSEGFTSGFQAHYYYFSETTLIPDGLNTIYIQVWPGATGSISDFLFIGEQQDTFFFSELFSFLNSKIYIFCAGLMVITFLFYIIAYMSLRKHTKVPEFLSFALQTLSTTLFLFSFFAAETPWFSLHFTNYLVFLKLFFCTGFILTVYFNISFSLKLIRIPYSHKFQAFRLLVLFTTLIIFWAAPSLLILRKLIPIAFIYLTCQESVILYYSVKAYKNKRNKEFLLKKYLALLPTVVAVVIDIILRKVFKVTYLPYITLYGWQITIFIFLSYMLKSLTDSYVRNITLRQKLSNFTYQLETQIKERTQELSSTNSILASQVTKINADLVTATFVQQGFLPPKEATFNDWDIAICYLPMDNVSGDLYDYYSTDSNELEGIGLFDVSGHGTSAGLLTMLSKNIIYQNYTEGKKNKLSVSEILQNVNNSIIKQKSYSDRYLTGVLLNFDKKKKDCIKGTMASAGHPAPLLYSAKENSIKEIKYSDPSKQYGIIGFKDFDVSFPNIELETYPDDIILLYTDGITESINENSVPFGKDGLIKLLDRYHFQSASQILDTILDSLKFYVGDEPIKDDITMIIMKRRKES